MPKKKDLWKLDNVTTYGCVGAVAIMALAALECSAGEIVAFALLFALILWRTSEARLVTKKERQQMEEAIRSEAINRYEDLAKETQASLTQAFHLRMRSLEKDMQKQLAALMGMGVGDPQHFALILSFQVEHGVPTIVKVEAELRAARERRGYDQNAPCFKLHDPKVQNLKLLLSRLQKLK